MQAMPRRIPATDPVTMRRPHVVIVNRSFWPDTEATGQLLTELAIDLTAWFDITVIVGYPNHVDAETNEHFAALDEYRGVTIRRVRHLCFSKLSWFGRLANLATFTISAVASALTLSRSPDAIVVETDPFLLPLAGRLLQCRYRKASLVCYLQDLYPDIALAVGKVREGVLTRLLRALLVATYRRADRVLVLSRDMHRRCEALGVPSKSLEIVSNWADPATIYPVKTDNSFRKVHHLESRFVVMYSGNMGLAHELGSIIDAAEVLRDRTDIVWVFIGNGAQRAFLESEVLRRKLSLIRFLPFQPRTALAQSLSAADVHLVSLRAGAAACVMPSKFYGILASGTPTLAMTESGTELSDLVMKHEVGFTCEPGDSAALAAQVRQLADDKSLVHQLGRNARTLAETTFSRTRQTTQIAAVLFRVTGQETPAALAGLTATHNQDSVNSHVLVRPAV